jgi:hypothetical protein
VRLDDPHRTAGANQGSRGVSHASHSDPQSRPNRYGALAWILPTGIALSSISIWLVPPYLALMCLLLYWPEWRAEAKAKARRASLANQGALALIDRSHAHAGSPRFERATGSKDGDRLVNQSEYQYVGENGSSAGDGAATAIVEVESTGSSDETPAKPKRGRGRGRPRTKRPPVEIDLDRIDTSAWVQVKPGKFVRIEEAGSEAAPFLAPTPVESSESSESSESIDITALKRSEEPETAVESELSVEGVDERISLESAGANPSDESVADSTRESIEVQAEGPFSEKTLVEIVDHTNHETIEAKKIGDERQFDLNEQLIFSNHQKDSGEIGSESVSIDLEARVEAFEDFSETIVDLEEAIGERDEAASSEAELEFHEVAEPVDPALGDAEIEFHDVSIPVDPSLCEAEIEFHNVEAHVDPSSSEAEIEFHDVSIPVDPSLSDAEIEFHEVAAHVDPSLSEAEIEFHDAAEHIEASIAEREIEAIEARDDSEVVDPIEREIAAPINRADDPSIPSNETPFDALLNDDNAISVFEECDLAFEGSMDAVRRPVADQGRPTADDRRNTNDETESLTDETEIASSGSIESYREVDMYDLDDSEFQEVDDSSDLGDEIDASEVEEFGIDSAFIDKAEGEESRSVEETIEVARDFSVAESIENAHSGLNEEPEPVPSGDDERNTAEDRDETTLIDFKTDEVSQESQFDYEFKQESFAEESAGVVNDDRARHRALHSTNVHRNGIDRSGRGGNRSGSRRRVAPRSRSVVGRPFWSPRRLARPYVSRAPP